MIVVDASALAAMLMRLPLTPVAEERLASQEMAAPHLLDLEVAAALRRAEASARLGHDEATECMAILREMTIQRFRHNTLIARIWALRHNFTPYDAAYLALAEALTDDGVPLLTLDAHFARAARKHTDVEVLLAA